MSRVLHFEIQADDVERAKAFYAAVFGVMMILLGLRLRKADRSDGAAFDNAPPTAKA
mgnify:CR=1 FL=1